MGRPSPAEWVNRARPLGAVLLVGGPAYAVFLLYLGGAPSTTDVGYQPQQPVAYSHLVHAGQMGIDCRYCHTTVETDAFAAVPATSMCMNCHRTITPDSEKLKPIVASSESGRSVPWVRVHDLPDYVYFDHRGHVGRGVSCVSCHGRVDRMEQVHQIETLSMGWCLECHRDPVPNIRPLGRVFDLGWDPAEDAELAEKDPRAFGEQLMKEMAIAPSTDCSTCHR